MTESSARHCGIARECGACARIDEAYAQQLAWKADRVRTALAHHAGLDAVPVDACVAAPDRWRYRNRAKLAVRAGSDGVHVGLFARGSNRIVDLAPCVVQRPVLQEGLERLRRWLERHRMAAPQGAVFYADLRETRLGHLHATLVVTEPGPEPAALSLAELRDAWPELDGLALNYGDPRSSYPLGARTAVVFGAPHLEMSLETITGARITFEVPVGGFFQVSTALLPEIHRRMLAHLGETGLLYDLYCGVGVHGLMLALARDRRDAGIVGVEDSDAACDAARANAVRLGVAASYRQGAVEEVLRALVAEAEPARVVLNPGRAGCKPAALEALPGRAPLAYLSCDPVTLARDLAFLVARGRTVVRLTPFDLMPNTDHVEALALVA